jgi:Regulator of ribonuclease activity B
MIPRLTLMAALLVSGCSQARETDSVISKDQLVEMFQRMEQKSHWDMSKAMLWGYFFTDASKSDLEAVVPSLEAQGYRLVDIYLSDKEDPKDDDHWWLHVEKVEVHTLDSLDERNTFFYQFAEDHGLDSYDGMDVGPVAKAN